MTHSVSAAPRAPADHSSDGQQPTRFRRSPRDVPKVALLIETSRGFGRDFLLGIARYARLHGPWSFHITPGDYKQVVP